MKESREVRAKSIYHRAYCVILRKQFLMREIFAISVNPKNCQPSRFNAAVTLHS